MSVHPVKLACGAVFALFLLAQSVFADGVIRDGVGAISMGRGGTNIAQADTVAIILDNPAGMVNLAGSGMIEIGGDLVFCNVDYAEAGTAISPLKLFPLGQFGYIRKSGCGNWAFGVGAFAPAGFGTDYNMAGPAPIGGTQHYKSIGALGKFVPAVACKLTERTSIGATLGVGVSHAELEGPFFLQTGMLQGTPALLDLQASGATMVWSVGLQHQLTDQTSLGITYTSEARFKMDGSAEADIYGMGPGPINSRFDADVELDWPRSLGIGAKHDLCCCKRVSADVIWFNWSDAFQSFDMTLADASNPVFTPMLPIRDSLPLNWRDTVSVRLGYEQDLSEVCTIRTGYVYHRNPIPDSTITPYIPATLEHAIAVGMRRKIADLCNFDISYMYTFGPSRQVATSGVVGGDFDNSQIDAQAHWLSVGISRAF